MSLSDIRPGEECVTSELRLLRERVADLKHRLALEEQQSQQWRAQLERSEKLRLGAGDSLNIILRVSPKDDDA